MSPTPIRTFAPTPAPGTTSAVPVPAPVNYEAEEKAWALAKHRLYGRREGDLPGGLSPRTVFAKGKAMKKEAIYEVGIFRLSSAAPRVPHNHLLQYETDDMEPGAREPLRSSIPKKKTAPVTESRRRQGERRTPRCRRP